MNMEWKVEREIQWDYEENNGRTMNGVMRVILQNPSAIYTEEELHSIGDVLGNYSEARMVEWRTRAFAHLNSLSKSERRKLEWTGTDEVTDLSTFSTNKKD